VFADYLIAVISEILSELRLDQGELVANSPMVIEGLLWEIKRPYTCQEEVAPPKVGVMLHQVPTQHGCGVNRTEIRAPPKS
jgi:hypothetical protein